uniref:NADH dehydrogenase subunit 1 n=1 Tax=Hydroptila angulata TaxID=1875522 RepID=UPI0022DCE288|nr:NADH dehydrogenase subunit 1 [Hydroptila angulata]UZZ44051.1 NADH dehydrogenase subunit 1 [Hydroptila angulata]
MIVNLLMILLIMLGVLISVAFFTLLERKILGYIQIRMGPNKVFLVGILQPFSDAVKLFVKEFYFPLMSNYMMYYYGPVILFMLSLLIWVIMPYKMNLLTFEYGILFIMCILSMGVYGLLISGWSSNSSYAMLGAMRAIAQMISYEVYMSLILLALVFLMGSYNIYMFDFIQKKNWLIMFVGILILGWLVFMMAETNRTPFDFAEGESELVSGFNIEYGSGGFALIFLGEYASILFMSMLFSYIYLGGVVELFSFYLKLMFLGFIFIVIRGLMPRYRYDKLMSLAWKIYLPIFLNFMLFVMGIKFCKFFW